MPFVAGDKVLWSHSFSTLHADGSVIRSDAVESVPDGKLGTVTGPANDENTWWNVALDDGEEVTLTDQELVKVAE